MKSSCLDADSNYKKLMKPSEHLNLSKEHGQSPKPVLQMSCSQQYLKRVTQVTSERTGKKAKKTGTTER